MFKEYKYDTFNILFINYVFSIKAKITSWHHLLTSITLVNIQQQQKKKGL